MEEKYDKILDSPVRRKNVLLDRIANLDKYDKSNEQEPIDPNNIDFSLSSIYNESKKKKKKNVEDADDWFNTISSIRTEAVSKKNVRNRTLFGEKKKNKKKKKENDAKELKDFNKEFQDEMYLLDNILADQNKFTTSLQNRYNITEQAKSSVRGTGKFTTDLIGNITSARSLTLQIIEKRINLKKTIHELGAKQLKELGGDIDSGDINNQAAQYLREILSTKHEWDGKAGANDFVDVTENNMDGFLDMDGVEFDDDTEAYIKYEQDNVKIWVIYNRTDLEYEFEARTETGKVLTDYPLPIKTPLSINYSTNMATDEYGEKYPVEFVEG